MNIPVPDKNYWYQKLVAPRSITPDDQRRELILNILLTGMILASVFTSLANIINHLSDTHQVTNSIVEVLGFTFLLVGFLVLSRKGYYKPVSYAFLGLVICLAVYLLLVWGFTLSATQLVFVLAIVLAGVLLSAKRALLLTMVMAAIVLVLSYLQVNGYTHPDLSWANEKLKFVDSFGFATGLLITGLVSWLANREIDRSLARARRSEAELAEERDQLEIKVVQRTRELERAQLEHVMELQRLAEFGRLSAGLLHDVANPLTAASLNLKELGTVSQSLLLRQALQSLHYIERFLDSARKQLRSQGSVISFTVSTEIKQVIQILNHRAREMETTVNLKTTSRFRLTGDPVKFSQVIANLVLNAIESYSPGDDRPNREITVEARQEGKWVVVSVLDHGRGLQKDQIGRIFDTFYSTQDPDSTNMGIGLATVKRLVEKDFKGRIKVTSSSRAGTKFTVYLRDQVQPGKRT